MNSVIATGGGVRKLACLLKNDLDKCALLGSFVLSLISFLGIPALLRYGELHREIWRALLAAGFVLTAVIAILFLAALGYFAERQVLSLIHIFKTDMSNKAIEASKQTLKHCILDIKKDILGKGINKFNATVMGIQDVYKRQEQAGSCDRLCDRSG